MIAWYGIILLIRIPEFRAFIRADAAETPLTAIVFWVVLEMPAEIALILVVLGLFPSYAPALYTTALVLGLLQAATVLSRVVYARFLRG